MYDLVLRDATLVSPTGRIVADVAVLNGKIAYVGPRPPRPARREIRAIGKFLMPGVIDLAVQFDPNGDGADWSRESGAAVTGGVTTAVCLPGGAALVVDRASANARIKRINGHSYCDYGLWGCAAEKNGAALLDAAKAGATVGSLAYVGGARSDAPAAHASTLSDLLAGAAVLAARVDDPAAAGDLIGSARTLGRALHLAHVSTASELHMIDPVHGATLVTAGVTPHHLFLSPESSDACTSPPVRAEHDRRTLWSAVKRGRLDCVSSDHHAGTGLGVPGSELILPLMLAAVKQGRLALETMVQLCSAGPAAVLGLTTKGSIARGFDADLVLFTEGDLSKITHDDLLSGAGWSPYLDREAGPKPELVMVSGQIVAVRGKLTEHEPSGRVLRDRVAP